VRRSARGVKCQRGMDQNTAVARDFVAAHAQPIPLRALRIVPKPLPPPPRFVTPLPPCAAPRGLFTTLWLWIFGPPRLELPLARSDFGVFRALSEVGSDYLPSSGTWPSGHTHE
jgi:hypothetical protein